MVRRNHVVAWHVEELEIFSHSTTLMALAEALGAMSEMERFDVWKQLKSMGCHHWVRNKEQTLVELAKGGFSVVLLISVVFCQGRWW